MECSKCKSREETLWFSICSNCWDNRRVQASEDVEEA
jgi:hypothetical protein